MKTQFTSLVVLAAFFALAMPSAGQAFVLNEQCVTISVLKVITHADGSHTVLLSDGTKQHVAAENTAPTKATR